MNADNIRRFDRHLVRAGAIMLGVVLTVAAFAFAEDEHGVNEKEPPALTVLRLPMTPGVVWVGDPFIGWQALPQEWIESPHSWEDLQKSNAALIFINLRFMERWRQEQPGPHQHSCSVACSQPLAPLVTD